MDNMSFQEFIENLRACRESSLSEIDCIKNIDSFWLHQDNRSLSFLKFLTDQLRAYPDYLLVIACKDYDDDGSFNYSLDDYKEMALAWLHQKRLDLGEDKFELCRDDLMFRFKASKELLDYLSIDYHSIEAIVHQKQYEYKKEILSLQHEIILLFTSKIDEELNTVYAIESKKIVDEKLVELRNKLLKEYTEDSFYYAPELKQVFLERINSLEKNIQEINKVEDASEVEIHEVSVLDGGLNRVEKLLLIEYFREAKLFVKYESNLTQKAQHIFFGALTGIAESSVKSSDEEINSIKTGKASEGQVKHRLKNLRRVLAIVESMGDEPEVIKVVKKIKENIVEIENAGKKNKKEKSSRD